MKTTQKYKDVEALVNEHKNDFLKLGKAETLKLFEKNRRNISANLYDLMFDAIMNLFEKCSEN